MNNGITLLAGRPSRQLCYSHRDPSVRTMHLSFWHHPPLVPPQFYWDRYAKHGDTRLPIGRLIFPTVWHS